MFGEVGLWPWAGELAWDATELTASDIDLSKVNLHSNFSISCNVGFDSIKLIISDINMSLETNSINSTVSILEVFYHGVNSV